MSDAIYYLIERDIFSITCVHMLELYLILSDFLISSDDCIGDSFFMSVPELLADLDLWIKIELSRDVGLSEVSDDTGIYICIGILEASDEHLRWSLCTGIVSLHLEETRE